jgi:SAM-dependent methyltransferase
VSWSYGRLASEVYDLDKPIGSSFGEVEYYRDLLVDIDGPVLEPAVGTGRILIPLLAAGFTVDGFDSSPEMLAVCRRNCAARELTPVLAEGDMTEWVKPDAYAAVIVPTGSIVLLDGADETTLALRCFARSLRPGGRLILDVPSPRLVASAEPMRHWRAGNHIWTLQTLHIDYDPVANQTTRWLRYDKWLDGDLVGSELQPFRLQHWTIREFAGLLAEAGFVDTTVTADYRPGTPTADSDDWTFHAVRH